MAKSAANGAERVRRHRARKRCGTVYVSGIEVKSIGIELLIAKGWLAADAEHDPVSVRTALVKLVNKTLTAPEPEPQPKRKPGRFKQALQAVKGINFGLF